MSQDVLASLVSWLIHTAQGRLERRETNVEERNCARRQSALVPPLVGGGELRRAGKLPQIIACNGNDFTRRPRLYRG